MHPQAYWSQDMAYMHGVMIFFRPNGILKSLNSYSKFRGDKHYSTRLCD